MRVLFIALLLAAPLATADDRCADGTLCATAWSAKSGTCNSGAGFERNSAEVEAIVAGADVETFCVAAGSQRYNGWTGDAHVAGADAFLLWSNSQGACSITLFVTSPSTTPQQRDFGCPGQTPPLVPALLP